MELTDSNYKRALLFSTCFNCRDIQTLDAYWKPTIERDWLDCKIKNKLWLWPFSTCWKLHMGAIISAAGKHKPKVALVAPGLLIYAAQSLLHSLRGLVQK